MPWWPAREVTACARTPPASSRSRPAASSTPRPTSSRGPWTPPSPAAPSTWSSTCSTSPSSTPASCATSCSPTARVSERGGWVRIVYTHHLIKRVIEICGLTEVFPQYPTVAAAISRTPHLDADVGVEGNTEEVRRERAHRRAVAAARRRERHPGAPLRARHARGLRGARLRGRRAAGRQRAHRQRGQARPHAARARARRRRRPPHGRRSSTASASSPPRCSSTRSPRADAACASWPLSPREWGMEPRDDGKAHVVPAALAQARGAAHRWCSSTPAAPSGARAPTDTTGRGQPSSRSSSG